MGLIALKEREMNYWKVFAPFHTILPINVNAGFGKHKVPQIQIRVVLVHRLEAVVNQQTSIRNPQRGEDEDDAGQHLHNLKKGTF